MSNKITNRWGDFQNNETYRLVDLGHPAEFLLPSAKLKTLINDNDCTVEKMLHAFLLEQFGAFTTTTFATTGIWRSNQETVYYDECRRYEVSFAGKDRIPLLMEKLAKIAKEIGEECIYFKAGQYSCAIYPA